MKTRFAFAGFRHNHILGMYNAVANHPDAQIVAACEEDGPTRQQLKDQGKIAITHDSCAAMLAQVPCDVLAVGDLYAKRGGLLIRGLEAGKHVIADKPICTRLDELDRIEELSRGGGLAVGCQFDLRSSGSFLAVRKLLQDGAIGDVQTICFTGQHPLSYGKRPDWYFQDGCHGGTINDIFIHAADALEWLTGRRIVEVVAARAWNSSFPQAPKFQIGAQVMLRLDNDAGVLGDVSYLAPEGCGHGSPTYWRLTLHGSGGMIEFQNASKSILLAAHSDASPRQVDVQPKRPDAYLADFLSLVQGRGEGVSLTTAQVLRASRIALLAQKAADQSLRGVSC